MAKRLQDRCTIQGIWNFFLGLKSQVDKAVRTNYLPEQVNKKARQTDAKLLLAAQGKTDEELQDILKATRHKEHALGTALSTASSSKVPGSLSAEELKLRTIEYESEVNQLTLK